jgi:type IV pilus assembly protein PilV
MATRRTVGTLARVRRPEGYTLIEVVVALSVISVGLLGVFHMLASTIYTNVDSRNRAIATHFAERRLEVVRETDVESLASSQGNTDDDLTRRLDDDATWDLTVSDPTPGVAADAPGTVLKAVTVTVRWKQGTDQQSVSLSTLAHSGGIGTIRKR